MLKIIIFSGCFFVCVVITLGYITLDKDKLQKEIFDFSFMQ